MRFSGTSTRVIRLDDVKLRQEGTIRIYDIIFSYDVLLETDALHPARFYKGRSIDRTFDFIIC